MNVIVSDDPLKGVAKRINWLGFTVVIFVGFNPSSTVIKRALVAGIKYLSNLARLPCASVGPFDEKIHGTRNGNARKKRIHDKRSHEGKHLYSQSINQTLLLLAAGFKVSTDREDGSSLLLFSRSILHTPLL